MLGGGLGLSSDPLTPVGRVESLQRELRDASLHPLPLQGTGEASEPTKETDGRRGEEQLGGRGGIAYEDETP